jgi:NADH-quinone oxidoreductase subunit L
MLIPLVVLAVLAMTAGLIGIPRVLHGSDQITQFLTPAAHEAESEAPGAATTELLLMATSAAVALAGALTAYVFYAAKPELPERLATKAHAMYSILLHKYYVDELYDEVIVWPIVQTSREFLWKFVDVFMIDGAVNGIGQIVRGSAGGLRHMQSGYVRTYAGWILFGGVLVVFWFWR